MLRKGHILAIVIVSASFITVLGIDAQQELSIPEWVKNNALWWGQGEITDTDFISAINFLIEQKYVKVPSSDVDEQREYSQRLQTKINAMQAANEKLNEENKKLKQENAKLYDDYIYYYNLYFGTDSSYTENAEPELNVEQYCYGNADCFVGHVTQVTDGDTIEVDGKAIRLALVNAPELSAYGGKDAKSFVESVCPVGSAVLVDEDDGQTSGSYGRIIAVVYCDTGFNLNEMVISSGLARLDTPYCENSEFGSHYWALLYGCGYEEPSYQAPKSSSSSSGSSSGSSSSSSCDPSYPDVCIPPYPPDLDCGEISYRNFRVVGSDPHRFDGDHDGIGCES